MIVQDLVNKCFEAKSTFGGGSIEFRLAQDEALSTINKLYEPGSIEIIPIGIRAGKNVAIRIEKKGDSVSGCSFCLVDIKD